MLSVLPQDYSVPEISLFPEENAEGKKVIFRDTSEDARIFGFPIKATSIIINAGLWVVNHDFWANVWQLSLTLHLIWLENYFHITFHSHFSPAQMARLRTSLLPRCTASLGGRGVLQPCSLGSGTALRGLTTSTQSSKYHCWRHTQAVIFFSSWIYFFFHHRVNQEWKIWLSQR